ncbi:LysR substrate-binding domain-containing protein [Caballeronia terrestris]|uniref:LysR substrate-binding domain-containing protein n=1 Tax=Caballeronia terrestris TaxID=1226301 RepID=UPI001F1C2981|nr:LysR substrate-binding domain-containing protein [Caballeronia terrestris]
MVIAASPDYLAQHGTPHQLEDIDNHSCIVGYRRGQPLSWRVHVGGEPKRISPPGTHQISDGDSIVEAALAGLGLCQMPMSLVRPHLATGRFAPCSMTFHASSSTCMLSGRRWRICDQKYGTSLIPSWSLVSKAD